MFSNMNIILSFLFVYQENAVVIHSIVGWKSSIGKWSRVQASFSLYHSFLSSFKFNESLFYINPDNFTLEHLSSSIQVP
jgi:hypothetical protein